MPQPAPYAYPYVPRARISKVWAWLPLLSFGMLAFLPFLRLAVARGGRRDWITFASYFGVSVLVLAIDGAGLPKGPVGAVFGASAFALVAVATAHALIEFRSLPPAQSVPLNLAAPNLAAPNLTPPYRPHDPVSAARARIGLRARSRELATKDPALARELRIGRPDLAREYDDGGLVDVNGVPAAVLVQHLQLTPQEARAVLDARGQLGRFTSAEEVSVYSQLPPARLDAVRDLLWFG